MSRNVVILGDPSPLLPLLKGARFFAIVSQHDTRSLAADARNFFQKIYSVETEQEFDTTCFEKKLQELEDVLSQIQHEHGAVAGLVSINEHTVLPCAHLRRRFNIPGLDLETAEICRDKLLMRERMNAVSPRVEYLDLERSSSRELSDFLRAHGPAVSKPRRQSSSLAVHVVHDEPELRTAGSTATLLEAFVDHPVMHLDGYALQGKVRFLVASHSAGTCLAYTTRGGTLGSVVVTDAHVYRQCLEFAQLTVDQLGLLQSTFHIECFMSPDGLIFLEAGARWGGGGIVDLVRYATGVDLSHAGYLIDANDDDMVNLPTRRSPPDHSVAMLNFSLPPDKRRFLGWHLPCCSGTRVLAVEARRVDEEIVRDDLDRFGAVLRVYIAGETDQEAMQALDHLTRHTEILYA